MVTRTHAIRRDVDAAGSVNRLLAPWAFVTDDVFVTKSGDLGLIYRLHGQDYEGLDPAERRAITRAGAAALRLLDEQMRLYQYLVKRRVPPLTAAACDHPVVHAAIQARVAHLNAKASDLYELDTYLVLLYEGLASTMPLATKLTRVWRHPLAAVRAWLSPTAVVDLLQADLDRAIGHLRQVASGVEVQLAETVRPVRLHKAEMFRFFRALVNYDPPVRDAARLTYDVHLDFFMADSSIACDRGHLDVGDIRVKVLTMQEPPSATYAHVLEDLYTLPGELIACLEWRRLPADRMRRDLHARRRHHHNRQVSLVNYVSTETRPEEVLVDTSEASIVRQLGDALTAVEVDGHFFGECSLTLVLLGTDAALSASTAEALKVLAAHDGRFHVESYNLLNAWAAIVPGNHAYNVRRLALLETHCADLSFLFALDQGERTAAALGGRDALAILETRQRLPYFFNLHVQDVGHMLVLGATGSGKSFLLNFLTTHAQQYQPRTVIFDLGHSYRRLAHTLGGSYLALGPQAGVTINPFALPNTLENRHFQHALVRVLLESVDAYQLSEHEDRELYEAIAHLSVLDPDQRRLATLAYMLPAALHQRLDRWIDDGRHAHLFDHVEDTLDVHDFQVFEFEAMQQYPALLEPLLFYILHRVTTEILATDRSRFTLCVMDEAWRFIRHPRLRAYVEEALKTWRKKHAAMVIATQAVQDLADAALLRTVIENAPTTLFLANPKVDQAQYTELFGLNPTQIAQLTSLAAKRELLLKRQHLSKVLTLDVDAASLDLYSTRPIEARARAVDHVA